MRHRERLLMMTAGFGATAEARFSSRELACCMREIEIGGWLLVPGQVSV